MSSQRPLLQPLQKTQKAISKIQQTLQPYLNLLQTYQNAHSKRKASSSSTTTATTNQRIPTLHQVTEAQAAIALSIGTLRFMAARLKGQTNRGTMKGDALRLELDKIRTTLVELRKLAPPNTVMTTTTSSSRSDGSTKTQTKKSTKRLSKAKQIEKLAKQEANEKRKDAKKDESKGKRKHVEESEESPASKKRVKSPP